MPVPAGDRRHPVRRLAAAQRSRGSGSSSSTLRSCGAALRAVLDADLRVVVGELAPERGERLGAEAAAGVPGGGVASVAAWSISVPKIDSVPSRLSMISSSRDWIGQSISDAVSIAPEAARPVAAAPGRR